MKRYFAERAVAGLFLLLGATTLSGWAAQELKSGEFSFVKNQVEHESGGTKSLAKEKDALSENSVVDTGAQALTQLNFTDASVLRLGPSTQFSFRSKERIIKLDRGALLMNVPPGNGGITVDGGGVTGAVSGSTVMASRDDEGNFAFVILETQGAGKVTSGTGQTASLLSGQIALVRKADGVIRIYDLNLDALKHSSPFFNAFPTTLPGFEKVAAVADDQAGEVKSGIKALLAYLDVGLKPEDPDKHTLAALFGKASEDIVVSKNSFLGELATAAGGETAQDSSAAPVTLGTGTGTAPLTDVRQPGGEELIGTNPGQPDDGLGDTDTAAGGGGGGTDTQPPTPPVGGGTTVNPPPATPTGRQ